MRSNRDKYLFKALIKVSRHTILIAFIIVVCIAITFVSSCNNQNNPVNTQNKPKSNSRWKIPANAWKAPDTAAIPLRKSGDLIGYGKDLLAHTANYFGPNGSVAQISNGMNCQNCHLDGGRKLFGNNYSVFIASYPKWSDRSGTLQPATRRITDCFNRSLAGAAPDTNGREVQAMLAYMKWLGQGVKKGKQLFGTGSEKLAFLDHPADPEKGEAVYIAKCKVCHGSNGAGLLAVDKRSYTYPPLWGEHSYNDGAGMYRISNLAGFVKNNMPFGATYQNPQLTNEEAWNVAAFVNSQPRPHKDQHNDWQNLKKKPIDFPFGPYADKFSEKQHKYGPFKPIKDAQKGLTNNKL